MTEHDIAHTVATYLLHGTAIGCPEITDTALRPVTDPHTGEPLWEVEVAAGPIGVAITLRDECPLVAAVSVVSKMAAIIAASAPRPQAN